MIRGIAQRFDSLIDHYTVVCLFLALPVLTLLGIGDVRVVSLLGLLLCAVGLTQASAKADFWVLAPLVLYNAASMASSYATYGNITDGYSADQWIFSVLYLLMACLSGGELLWLKRLCALWAGVVAVLGIGRFVWYAVVRGSAARLGGLLGNPNAMGMFLVAGYFLLLHDAPKEQPEKKRRGKEKGEQGRRWAELSPYIEPVLLIALALTLSMGSFVAMAAGLLVFLLVQARGRPRREVLLRACRLLAKAGLGVGTGLLLYLGAARTDVPWICLPLLLYGVAVVACWRKLERFLTAYPRAAVTISVCGVLVAASAVVMRPSATATFAERLEMMGSGLRYLTVNPLLGVGPYQWRLLDLSDGGTYFNTWHIHNVLIHVGVELGFAAMAMLVFIAVRAFTKKSHPSEKAGFTAFFVHNLMDTSFFYLGITALVLLGTGEPGVGGKKVGGGVLKVMFGLLALLFAYNFYYCIRGA